MALNKELTAAAAIAQLRSGMTLGIGGWGRTGSSALHQTGFEGN